MNHFPNIVPKALTHRVTSTVAAAAGVLPPLGIGISLMVALGAPRPMPAINAVAAALGFLVIFLAGETLAGHVSLRPARVAASVLAAEALTLADSDSRIDGVRRWVSTGGIRVHPATIGTPVLLLAIAVLWRRERYATARFCLWPQRLGFTSRTPTQVKPRLSRPA